MVSGTARTLLTSRLKEVSVVLGHEAGRVRSHLEGLYPTLVVNPHHREGRVTSVHVGLAALSRPCDGVMICLSEQPLLESADIDQLIEAFDARKRGSVLVATYEGRRGNAIMLGCERFIENNSELVETFEMDTDHVVFDLDSPEEYRELSKRLGETRDIAV